MALSETPFMMAAKAILDPSKIADEFRDGQKLRQEWDARQAFKDYNRIMQMQLPDQVSQLDEAKKSKYASGVTGLINDYYDNRQKQATARLKEIADINKTNSDATASIAKAGKDGMDTQSAYLGQILPRIASMPHLVPAITKQMVANGTMTQDMANSWNEISKMSPSVQAMAMRGIMSANPDMAKNMYEAFKQTNLGGQTIQQIYNPVTGTMETVATLNNSATPDKVLEAQTNITTTGMTAELQLGVADINGSYGVKKEQISQDGANFRNGQDNETKRFEIKSGNDIKWFTAENNVNQRQQEIGIKQQQIAKGVSSANSPEVKQREEGQRTQRVATVLDDIEAILPDATHSWAGTGVDMLGSVVGVSTKGGVATSKLQTLAGQLVALMPKMSGPQSDKDVAMYKEMAGKLGDSTIPLENRMEALKTIRALNAKYAQLNGTALPNQSAQAPAEDDSDLFH